MIVIVRKVFAKGRARRRGAPPRPRGPGGRRAVNLGNQLPLVAYQFAAHEPLGDIIKSPTRGSIFNVQDGVVLDLSDLHDKIRKVLGVL